MGNGETHSGWWDQASCRQVVWREAPGLDIAGGEEVQTHMSVWNWQVSLRKAKNLSGFKTRCCGK